MKVLVATDKPFAKVAVDGIREIIESRGFEFALLEKYTTVEELYEAVKDVHALIIRSDKVTAEVMDHAPELKIVVRAGAGYDNVDLAAASAKNIVVMNTPGQNSNAVAELALGMMVFLARKKFNGASGTELRGKKLGIHAFGNVGRYVAEIAKGFGMEVYAFDPFVDTADIEKAGVHAVNSVESLYDTCQYISLHIPANEKTKKSINFELLKRLPKNATIVNTARKEVIHEEDLLKIMEERADISYISDITPDAKDAFETNFADRIFFTPKKAGAQTAEANINAGLAAARQIADYFLTGNTTFKVN
ncbi:MAG TPA: 3-phosphoglycerate dehydrogenase [Saprospirales bacterium]|nr:3-phosphoglycerate dehydrogenase [Saprospirales bacterium]HAY70929.1 3-phosphoglycerate dehydrogenase [Saprospirales bacterium]HRQ30605.1 3-phosphoglycerate dehydrogenase [Saprospiraceae bacterium]